MPNFEHIIYQVDGPVADIMLNRPKAMNALSRPLRQEVTEALGHADRDATVKVVILSGVPESRAFSAGYDVSEDKGGDGTEGTPAQGGDPYGWRQLLEGAMRWEMELWSFRKPVIAQVHGYCLGGACELAMIADLTVASDDAIFGEPEIRFVTGPPALVMPWMVGIKRAKQLLLTGEKIDAATAEDWGMVNVVVPRDQLRDETLRWARKMAVLPTEALHYTKTAINRGMEVGGLRSTIELNLELCSLLDATPTDLAAEFEDRRGRDGLGNALRWLNDQFENA